jgi:hypothetical protein
VEIDSRSSVLGLDRLRRLASSDMPAQEKGLKGLDNEMKVPIAGNFFRIVVIDVLLNFNLPAILENKRFLFRSTLAFFCLQHQ